MCELFPKPSLRDTCTDVRLGTSVHGANTCLPTTHSQLPLISLPFPLHLYILTLSPYILTLSPFIRTPPLTSLPYLLPSYVCRVHTLFMLHPRDPPLKTFLSMLLLLPMSSVCQLKELPLRIPETATRKCELTWMKVYCKYERKDCTANYILWTELGHM